jgi:uncharacterized protein YjlB
MIEPEAFTFAGDGAIPNSRLPMLVYRQAVPADPDAIERIFGEHGWPPSWRDGVHPFHHFHSTAHEALGVARGHARVLFGGPNGRSLEITAGDVVVLPAGVGHCRQDASPDLLIVGAYPQGMAAGLDTRRGRPEELAEVRRNIANLSLHVPDPVNGGQGALGRLWERTPVAGDS